MIKGKTAEQIWIGFLLENHRPPTRAEFMDLGYSKTTYYRIRNDLPNDYMLAQQWVEEHWKITSVHNVGNYKLVFKEMM